MTNVTIAVIGVGSFVFGPSVLSQAMLEQRLDGVELALVDSDSDALQGYGRHRAPNGARGR